MNTAALAELDEEIAALSSSPAMALGIIPDSVKAAARTRSTWANTRRTLSRTTHVHVGSTEVGQPLDFYGDFGATMKGVVCVDVAQVHVADGRYNVSAADRFHVSAHQRFRVCESAASPSIKLITEPMNNVSALSWMDTAKTYAHPMLDESAATTTYFVQPTHDIVCVFAEAHSTDTIQEAFAPGTTATLTLTMGSRPYTDMSVTDTMTVVFAAASHVRLAFTKPSFSRVMSVIALHASATGTVSIASKGATGAVFEIEPVYTTVSSFTRLSWRRTQSACGIVGGVLQPLRAGTADVVAVSAPDKLLFTHDAALALLPGDKLFDSAGGMIASVVQSFTHGGSAYAVATPNYLHSGGGGAGVPGRLHVHTATGQVVLTSRAHSGVLCLSTRSGAPPPDSETFFLTDRCQCTCILSTPPTNGSYNVYCTYTGDAPPPALASAAPTTAVLMENGDPNALAWGAHHAGADVSAVVGFSTAPLDHLHRLVSHAYMFEPGFYTPHTYLLSVRQRVRHMLNALDTSSDAIVDLTVTAQGRAEIELNANTNTCTLALIYRASSLLGLDPSSPLVLHAGSGPQPHPFHCNHPQEYYDQGVIKVRLGYGSGQPAPLFNRSTTENAIATAVVLPTRTSDGATAGARHEHATSTSGLTDMGDLAVNTTTPDNLVSIKGVHYTFTYTSNGEEKQVQTPRDGSKCPVVVVINVTQVVPML